jgi:hypothetical protein
LTTAVARMAGLPDGVGRWTARENPADLVIWDGLPLDLRSQPLRVLVGGNIVSRSRGQGQP